MRDQRRPGRSPRSCGPGAVTDPQRPHTATRLQPIPPPAVIVTGEGVLDNSVDILVDVRLNAISRKKGFSKSALAGVLAEAGIGYRHERELGNPKDNREPFRRGLKSARDRYVRHLGNGAGPVYDELVALAQTVRVALLCFERDHIECHRSCITDGALQADPSVVLLKL